MAIWDNQYPYTDFHEMNLDFVLFIAIEMKTTLQQLQAALGRIETTETNVAQLQGDVAALQDSVMRLNTTLIQQGERIGTAEGNITSLNTVVASLRSDILTLQGLINDTISPQIDVLSGRVTVNETHIAALEEAVSSIQYDVDQINSGFATAKYRDVQQDEINEVVYPYNHFDQRSESIESSGSLSTINGWYRQAWIDQTTGEPISHPTSASPYFAVTRLIPVYDASTLYTKSGSGQLIYPSIASPNSSAARIRGVAKYDGDGNFLSYRSGPMGSVSIEPEVAFIRIERTYSNVTNLTLYTVAEDQIEGTEYQTFTEPYSGLRQAISEYVTGQGQLDNDILLNLVQIFRKITGIGDSLMAGYMNRNGVQINSTTANTAGQNWISYMGMRTGCTITNLAQGSTGSREWRQAALLNTADIDTDAYIVAIGVNDIRGSRPVGTSADINATDKSLNADTYYGNLDYIINTLRTFRPAAQILVLTIPSAVQTPGTPSVVAPFNTAMRYVCGLYADHVHLIDLDPYAEYLDRQIISTNYVDRHLNPIAYNWLSVIIERAINRYMYVNQSLFPTAPYA